MINLATKRRKHKRRKVSSLGKLCILLLIILIIVFSVSNCIMNKRKSNNSNYEYNASGSLTGEIMEYIAANNKPKYATRNDTTKALDIESEYGILIDIENDVILGDKNGDKKIYPASLTKVMTLIVAVENIKDFDRTFTFTNELIDPLVQEEASRAGFDPYETVTLNDLLYGTVLPSGADATVGLAEYVCGGEDEFVKLMNKKVNELGLKNTHFMNTSGLHDEYHYSTAHEMALILEYAMKNKKCAEVLSTYTYTTSKTTEHPDGIELYSTMFSRMYGDEAEGVKIVSGKTGYTTEGGNCLASYAEDKNGKGYILVTTNAKGSYTPIYDAINAYADFIGTGEVTIKQEVVETY